MDIQGYTKVIVKFFFNLLNVKDYQDKNENKVRTLSSLIIYKYKRHIVSEADIDIGMVFRRQPHIVKFFTRRIHFGIV